MGDGQRNGTATPVASVTRIESFSASHRLHSRRLLRSKRNRRLLPSDHSGTGYSELPANAFRMLKMLPFSENATTQMVMVTTINVNHRVCLISVEVTVTGPVDRDTGMVINITDLKKYIQSEVMDALDHKNLDKDVPYFEKAVSTTENVAVFVWQQLSKVLPRKLQLRVRLHETDKNVVTYEGL
ncbi:6-pyruvoyl tetrahydrobiopterin synthase isoform X1 [Dermacentor andersoni]|uniref:6-pyruvoyl tetrahydrobiopterin synthase isoform X1 n=1 Tax=Dermacentor andersoni TaxID=34620 RepID=UPI002417171E|nr:6-pyruvoyl tetrahydrobiopterin synthase-like isoform X1 [Dermacentor andersoni]